MKFSLGYNLIFLGGEMSKFLFGAGGGTPPSRKNPENDLGKHGSFQPNSAEFWNQCSQIIFKLLLFICFYERSNS